MLKMYPGPDGLVRTVKVKTNDAVYVRPIQKLCLLETDVEDADKMEMLSITTDVYAIAPRRPQCLGQICFELRT